MNQSVFREILGADLGSVSGALGAFSDAPSKASGHLDVKHHPGRMARFFIWILKLPKEGTDQPVSIEIERKPKLERWRRRIGDSRFVTRHRAMGKYLEEKAGLFRFVHKVSAADGGMNYHQVRVYFLGIRLPHVFSPIINATAKGDDKGWLLDLTVSCPRCGPICQYKGWIEPE